MPVKPIKRKLGYSRIKFNKIVQRDLNSINSRVNHIYSVWNYAEKTAKRNKPLIHILIGILNRTRNHIKKSDKFTNRKEFEEELFTNLQNIDRVISKIGDENMSHLEINVIPTLHSEVGRSLLRQYAEKFSQTPLFDAFVHEALLLIRGISKKKISLKSLEYEYEQLLS